MKETGELVWSRIYSFITCLAYEEINDNEYELRYIPDKENVVTYALSRFPTIRDFGSSVVMRVPTGYVEMKMPGRGDSLFQCFANSLFGTQEQYLQVWETGIQDLLDKQGKYNLPTGKNHKTFIKQLHLMKHQGQLLHN